MVCVVILFFKTLDVNIVQKCQICVENEKPEWKHDPLCGIRRAAGSDKPWMTHNNRTKTYQFHQLPTIQSPIWMAIVDSNSPQSAAAIVPK